MKSRTRPPLPIPIRPIINFFAAKRGLQLGPILPDGCDPEIYEFFDKDRPLTTILDIGANVGNFAMRLSSAFPGAEIYCFEPIADTFRTLEKNVSGNTRVKCFNVAMGQHAGSAMVDLQTHSEWNSLLANLQGGMHATGIQAQVKVATIDDFCAEHGLPKVDLIKTDTEGFDLHVLRGGGKLLRNSVRFVLSEIGVIEADVRHTSFGALHAYPSDVGFQFGGMYDIGYRDDGVLSYANALFVRK